MGNKFGFICFSIIVGCLIGAFVFPSNKYVPDKVLFEGCLDRYDFIDNQKLCSGEPQLSHTYTYRSQLDDGSYKVYQICGPFDDEMARLVASVVVKRGRRSGVMMVNKTMLDWHVECACVDKDFCGCPKEKECHCK